VLFGTSQEEIPKHVFLYLQPVEYFCQLLISYIAFCFFVPEWLFWFNDSDHRYRENVGVPAKNGKLDYILNIFPIFGLKKLLRYLILPRLERNIFSKGQGSQWREMHMVTEVQLVRNKHQVTNILPICLQYICHKQNC